MEMKCGNRHPFTDHKFNKDTAYTVVPRTGNAKLLFYVGNVLFSCRKCCIQKVIPQKVKILQYLTFLALAYSKQHFAKGNTASY